MNPVCCPNSHSVKPGALYCSSAVLPKAPVVSPAPVFAHLTPAYDFLLFSMRHGLLSSATSQLQQYIIYFVLKQTNNHTQTAK